MKSFLQLSSASQTVHPFPEAPYLLSALSCVPHPTAQSSPE